MPGKAAWNDRTKKERPKVMRNFMEESCLRGIVIGRIVANALRDCQESAAERTESR